MVRKYSSENKLDKPDLNKIRTAAIWVPQPQVLSTKRGIHRFFWDLHYPLPDILKDRDSTEESYGIWALPGEYTVKLTLNGRSYTQPLLVRNDPRIKETQSDLVRQFEFAKQIQAERVKIASATREAQKLLKDSESIRPKTSADVASKIEAFQHAITDLTELRTVTPEYGTPDSYPGKITSLLFLSTSMKALQAVVDTTDGAPSPDVVSGFAKLRVNLKNTLADWVELKAKWLPGLNAVLQRENLSPLSPTGSEDVHGVGR